MGPEGVIAIKAWLLEALYQPRNGRPRGAPGGVTGVLTRHATAFGNYLTALLLSGLGAVALLFTKL